jgi:hypothetical protein
MLCSKERGVRQKKRNTEIIRTGVQNVYNIVIIGPGWRERLSAEDKDFGPYGSHSMS